MTYLLALDQGTSSSRSIVFDARGTIVAQAQLELPQIYPRPGWVEHDPLEIWRTQLATARSALQQAGIAASAVRALGITNQRETTVVWNRKTGQPIHHAIVWQDRRAEPACALLRERGMAQSIQQKTGLLIDAYFSGTKLQWLLDNIPGARAQAERGELAFGTLNSMVRLALLTSVTWRAPCVRFQMSQLSTVPKASSPRSAWARAPGTWLSSHCSLVAEK